MVLLVVKMLVDDYQQMKNEMNILLIERKHNNYDHQFETFSFEQI
jgi:hypothetical protein